MGSFDRFFRVMLALTVAMLWYLNVINGTLAIVLLILAGIFVITSVVGFCPLYTLLGVNTCSHKPNQIKP